MSRPGEVVVIGGGLAGLSAALHCLDAGARVTLLEGRPRLGGATWSFERGGLAFDNGQHVYLRCCTAYRRFLERLGTADQAPLQDRLALPVLAPVAGGEPSRAFIRRTGLPTPFHLAGSLATYRHLSLADRARLGRAVLALRRLDLSDPSLDETTLGEFLARHGQRPSAIANLWDLIALPTLNVRAADASLLLGAKVFRTGLLDDNSGADIGWARVPLAKLHVDPAVALLEAGGARVLRGAKVAAIEPAAPTPAGPGRLGVVLDDGRLEGDAVVLAVPHEAVASLLPAGARLDPARLAGLGTSPIVDVHVVYDRKVTDLEVAAGVGTPVQFLFDRTVAAGLDPAEGQVLAVSVSGADAEHGERPEVLVDRYTRALAELLPAARSAKVVDALVTREHSATFRAAPGTAALRPGPATGIEGLFLAGAWTDTRWPATMEGAVRSGTVAASCALHALGLRSGAHELAEEVA